MSNTRIICVTNRAACSTLAVDFLRQIREIAAAKPHMVIVREKDLAVREYELLAEDVLRLCRENDVKCVFHTFAAAAKKLGADGIHLTLADLRKFSETSDFDVIGCSVHSAEEAAEAKALGANYIMAGHIFQTDCKKDVPPRGTAWLEQVCSAVSIPVYELGGITDVNAGACISAGPAGVCVMSAFIRTSSPAALIHGICGLFPFAQNGGDVTFDDLAEVERDCYTLVDVRGENSFRLGSIDDAVNFPFPAAAARLYEIPREKPVLVYCQKGDVSREVTELLTDAGYEAYHLLEGYRGWLIRNITKVV